MTYKRVNKAYFYVINQQNKEENDRIDQSSSWIK